MGGLDRNAYIASQRSEYPIGFMCRMLEVSRSGFFAWQARARAPSSDADAPLREAIVEIHRIAGDATVAGASPTRCVLGAGA